MQNEALPGEMTVIEIKPHRWGWRVFEAPGVEPVFQVRRVLKRIGSENKLNSFRVEKVLMMTDGSANAEEESHQASAGLGQ
jgi:hypothetical protein